MIQKKINKKFLETFGKTPLVERLEDMRHQMESVERFGEISDLKQALGNLIASSIQCATESGWDLDDLVDGSLEYIESLKDHYEPLGRKTKVALFGGSFSPIHKGHVEFAKAIADAGVVDEVWIVPCNESRYGKSLIPGEHRLEMCRIAIGADKRLKVCDWEIANNTGGETYKLLKDFVCAPENAGNKFYFAIGLDNAYKAPGWVNWEFVERFVPFIIVPRKGVDKPDTIDHWFNKPPHIVLDEVDIVEASSSDVRKHASFGNANEMRGLLPENVYEYIRDHKLLQTT